MKKNIFYLLGVLVILSACQKSEETKVDPNPKPNVEIPEPAMPLGPKSGPDRGGLIFLSDTEYESLPKYVVKTQNGRQSNESVDLTVNMPPPDSQGEENSCVGWATGYSVRSYLDHISKKTNYWSSASVRNNKSVFSPRFIYNSVLLANKKTTDEGIALRDALNLLKISGVCTWDDMPYVPKHHNDAVSDIQKQKAANYKIKQWYALPMRDKNIKQHIKDYIRDKKLPVILGIKTDEGFQKPTENIGNGYELIDKEVYWKKFRRGSRNNHAIVVVGFDDTRNAFKLMNSYGNNWANKGFIWIDYSLFEAKTMETQENVILEGYVMSDSDEKLELYLGNTWTLRVKCTWDGLDEAVITFKNISFPENAAQAFTTQKFIGINHDAQEMIILIKGKVTSGVLDAELHIWDPYEEEPLIMKIQITLPQNSSPSAWTPTKTIQGSPDSCMKKEGLAQFKRNN